MMSKSKVNESFPDSHQGAFSTQFRLGRDGNGNGTLLFIANNTTATTTSCH